MLRPERQNGPNVTGGESGKPLSIHHHNLNGAAMQKAPPLGIMPERLWIENRFDELADACNRYLEAEKPIPPEWGDEMLRHARRLHDRSDVAQWVKFFGK